MRIPRSDIMKKILLIIDRHPSSIYDIQYSINGLPNPRKTQLPKLLKSMEDYGLVVSALQPGPLGPYRRMYELGPKASDYLNDCLRDAVETVLAFYSISKRNNSNMELSAFDIPGGTHATGTVLFAAFPRLTVDDLEQIRAVLSSRNGISISIVGNDEILNKTGITYQNMGVDILDIQAESDSIGEIRIQGSPPRNILSQTIAECKRVLNHNGALRLAVPFAFSKESENSKLEIFIKFIAESRFPELGLLDGKAIQESLKSNFQKTGLYENQLGEKIFWGIKS